MTNAPTRADARAQHAASQPRDVATSDNTPSVNPFAPRNTPSMGRPTTTNRVTVIERIMSRKDQPCFELFIPGQKGHAHQTVQFREIDNHRLMELFQDLPRQTKYSCELNVTWAHVKGWPVASKVEIVQKLTPQGRSTDMLIPEETKPAPVAKDFLGNALPGNPDSDDIDVALGRKAETPQPAAWVLDNGKRGAFMAKWGGLCAHYEIAQADRETLRHEILTALTGQPSLKGWTGTDEDLLKKMEGYIKDVLKKAPTEAAPANPTTTETSETPIASPSALLVSGNGNVAEKVREVREKFNAPQRGKDYLTVQGRIALFRLKFPMGTIDTELVHMDADSAVFKARVAVDGVVLATGYARSTVAGTKHLGGRFLEKGETAAVGRALAMAGFGTDDTLDDVDFLADSPVAA